MIGRSTFLEPKDLDMWHQTPSPRVSWVGSGHETTAEVGGLHGLDCKNCFLKASCSVCLVDVLWGVHYLQLVYSAAHLSKLLLRWKKIYRLCNLFRAAIFLTAERSHPKATVSLRFQCSEEERKKFPVNTRRGGVTSKSAPYLCQFATGGVTCMV